MGRLRIVVTRLSDGRRVDAFTCNGDRLSQGIAGTYLRHLIQRDTEEQHVGRDAA